MIQVSDIAIDKRTDVVAVVIPFFD